MAAETAVLSTAKRAEGLAPGDRIAVGAIVLGFLLMVVLMPPVRNFAMLDDWVYTHSAERIVNGQGLAPSDYAQATLVFHAYWGAAFIALLGETFTALAMSTIVLSLVGTLAFYAILRVLGFSAGLSGVGVAILALNPFYLYLSYTYMTEVTFTAVMLVACLCYLLGVRDRGSIGWLALGGVFAALAFLTRQFGLALPMAALIWLVLARKFTIGKAAAVGLLPLVAVVGYYAWSSGFGPSYSSSVAREELIELLHPGEWAQRASRLVYFALFLPGLTIALWSRPKRWRIALALAVLTAGAAFVLWQVKLRLVGEGQSSVDELSFMWLRPVFGDGVVITLVYTLGAGLMAWLVFGMVERGWPVVVGVARRRVEAPPAMLFFLVGVILFAGTYLVSAGFLDRYWVPILPFLIAGGLYGVKGRSLRSMIPVWVAIGVMGLYGVLIHLDDYAQMEARWAAGRELVASGVPLERIENGYAWDGYYMWESSIAHYPSLDIKVIGRIFPPYEVIVPDYVIDSAPREGYSVLKTYPYFSFLDGQGYREMLVLKR